MSDKTSEVEISDTITAWNTTTLEDFLVYNTPSNWTDFFDLPEVKGEIKRISDYLQQFTDEVIYPEIVNVFRALYLTNPHTIKAIILGQDPYHNGSAVGLAFSVKRGNDINPSLKNMYRELHLEGVTPLTENGDLNHWARQGILLINTAMTVPKGDAGAHIHIWNKFSNLLLNYINDLETSSSIVWLLFGNTSYQCVSNLRLKGRAIRTSHPSPFSANSGTASAPAFIGSGVFRNVRNIIW